MEKDKCMKLLEPEFAEFLMDLNGHVVTLAWELIRPQNRSKSGDMQCWESQQRKWAFHRNSGCNLPLPQQFHGPCFHLEAESMTWRGNIKSQWGTLDCKADNLAPLSKMLSLFLWSGRGTICWHPNCFGGFCWTPLPHQLTTLEAVGFQGWNQIIPLWAYCEMSLARSLGTNLLMA